MGMEEHEGNKCVENRKRHLIFLSLSLSLSLCCRTHMLLTSLSRLPLSAAICVAPPSQACLLAFITFKANPPPLAVSLFVCKSSFHFKHVSFFQEKKAVDNLNQKNKNNKNCGVGEKQSGLVGVGGVDHQRCQNGSFRRKSSTDYSSSCSSSSDWTADFSSSDNSVPTPRSNLNRILPSRPPQHNQESTNYKKSDGVCGGGGFVKKKSRALKNLYVDLKQQPTSPGRRLASFLNSLFTATATTKKGKISGGQHQIPPTSSAYSSASSFSRSCLSKTPSSSRGSAGKRSVRFYPVSVIVDEDSRPCGHKNVYSDGKDVMAVATAGIDERAKEELKYRITCESRRVEEVARELLKSYNQKKSSTTVKEDLFFRGGRDEEEDDDDEEWSCVSSDLFELDNLSSIEGIERYREELPVYETTHFSHNQSRHCQRLVCRP